MDENKEFRLQGAPVSEGIAIGTSFFFTSFTEEVIPEFSIQDHEIDEEIARYRRALLSCREDLLIIKQTLEKEGSQEAMDIIETHIQMLSDPLITSHVEEKVRRARRNTESVFSAVIREYEKKFS